MRFIVPVRLVSLFFACEYVEAFTSPLMLKYSPVALAEDEASSIELYCQSGVSSDPIFLRTFNVPFKFIVALTLYSARSPDVLPEKIRPFSLFITVFEEKLRDTGRVCSSVELRFWAEILPLEPSCSPVRLIVPPSNDKLDVVCSVLGVIPQPTFIKSYVEAVGSVAFIVRVESTQLSSFNTCSTIFNVTLNIPHSLPIEPIVKSASTWSVSQSLLFPPGKITFASVISTPVSSL